MSSEQKAQNITWQQNNISKDQRRKLNGHSSKIVWLTGLSGAGKSTLAQALDAVLFDKQQRSYVLDGDNVRHGLNKNLGFSPADRSENIRRIGEVAKLFVDAGSFAITAFISPCRADRDAVRALVEPGEFIEVYVQASLETCEARDPKGLYKKARAGEIPEFTGISAPYEAPLKPELIVDTDQHDVDSCVHQILALL